MGINVSEHTVQFFDSTESRIENVTAFLKAGHERGEPLVVIARASHWSALTLQLQQNGVPVSRLMRSGRLIARDATDMLEALRPRDRFDRHVFDRLIADPLKTIGKGSGARVYGEMVDILAEQREFAAALELEALWNALSAEVAINLLCGYCSAHFVSPPSHHLLLQICRAHAEVHHDEQDQLGSWLVATATGEAPQSAVGS